MGKDDSEHSNTDPKREIELGLSRALTRPDGTEIPVLSEMVSRSLTNIEASNKLSTLHRIGDHELHDPDYRLVCAFAEELGQDNEATLDELLGWGAEISEGRFVSLRLKDPLNSIPLIGGLELKKLYCEKSSLTELDLTPVPNLEVLACRHNKLTKMNLTPVPNLEVLYCSSNNLTQLDLTPVPNLEVLDCDSNHLAELDLTPVPNLKRLFCGSTNYLLSKIFPESDFPDINLAQLNLTPVPNLEVLDCSRNNLTELDLTPVPSLRSKPINL